jgi:hypothetical protein
MRWNGLHFWFSRRVGMLSMRTVRARRPHAVSGRGNEDVCETNRIAGVSPFQAKRSLRVFFFTSLLTETAIARFVARVLRLADEMSVPKDAAVLHDSRLLRDSSVFDSMALALRSICDVLPPAFRRALMLSSRRLVPVAVPRVGVPPQAGDAFGGRCRR